MPDPLHPLFLPLLTIEVYARSIGLTADTIRAQVDRGILPSKKIGKRRLVNVEAIRVLSALDTQERLL